MGWEGGGASAGVGDGSPGGSGHNEDDDEDGGHETITMGDTNTSPGEDLIALRTPKPSTSSRPLCQDTLLPDWAILGLPDFFLANLGLLSSKL